MDVPASRQESGARRPLQCLSERYGWAFWCAAVAGVAYCVAAGPAINTVNADSLVPVFVSLEKLTLFYWGQDRFGMLLPVLASPVHDGFWNLMLQNTMGTVLFLAGAAGAFRALNIYRPVACALILLAILLVFPGDNLVLLLLTTNQSYGPALGCYGLAVYCYRSPRRGARAAALILMTIGTWTNAAVGLLAACSAVALFLLPGARRAARALLIGSGLSLAVHLLLQQWAARPLVDVSHAVFPSPDTIPPLAWSFVLDALAAAGRSFWVVAGILWALAVVVAHRDPRLRREIPVLVVMAAGATIYALAMALFFQGRGRHLAPILPLIIGMPLAVMVRRYPRVLRSRGLPVAVVVALVLQTGLAMPATVRRDLLATLSTGKELGLFAKSVSVVTGDYWEVWPLAFAVNLLHEQVDGSRPVVPVAMRSDQLVQVKAAHLVPGALVAVVNGDTSYWQHGTHLPPLEMKQRDAGFDLATIATP